MVSSIIIIIPFNFSYFISIVYFVILIGKVAVKFMIPFLRFTYKIIDVDHILLEHIIQSSYERGRLNNSLNPILKDDVQRSEDNRFSRYFLLWYR